MHGSCLCGDVAWEADGPLELMNHCHCSFCRKAHGAPFGTYVAAPAEAFRLVRGADAIERYESSQGFFRPFCRRCGSVTPGDPDDGRVFMAAGCLDDDPGVRPVAHIFTASRPAWSEIHDDVPQFDAAPPGHPDPGLPPRELAPCREGVLRGSCLCGTIRYEVDGKLRLARNCHCSRCRKARSAAHTTNLFVAADAVTLTHGEGQVRSYQPPDARFFAVAFCAACGGGVPLISPGANRAVIPMAALDDEPEIRPDCHIFVASMAPWYEIADALTQHRERAPD